VCYDLLDSSNVLLGSCGFDFVEFHGLDEACWVVVGEVYGYDSFSSHIASFKGTWPIVITELFMMNELHSQLAQLMKRFWSISIFEVLGMACFEVLWFIFEGRNRMRLCIINILFWTNQQIIIRLTFIPRKNTFK